MSERAASERWIVVRNWERFQHYRDREPVWIKLYMELRNRDEWRHLTLAQRGLLVSIWVEYAASNGQLRTSDLPGLILQKLPLNSLESLNHAGFIELSASKPLALARAGAHAREEEEETDTPKSPRERGLNPRALGTNPRAAAKRDAPRRKAKAWIDNGLATHVPADRLPDVLADQFKISDPELVADLVAYATERIPTP